MRSLDGRLAGSVGRDATWQPCFVGMGGGEVMQGLGTFSFLSLSCLEACTLVLYFGLSSGRGKGAVSGDNE